MKLALDRAELNDALVMAASIAAARTPKESLKCILMEVFSDYVLLSATDLEIGIRCSISQVQVETTGTVLVPADKFAAIVRESSDELLNIEAKDQVCHVRGADSHFQVYTQDPKDFPPVPQLEGEADFQMKVADFRRLSDWTVFAAARENTRYAINGVLWDLRDGRLTLVATDGRRLSQAFHPLENGGEDRSAIVPLKAMQLFGRALPDAESTIEIKITENQIFLKSPRATMSSSLLEGHFPKYEDVIPNDCNKKVEFNVPALLSAVRRSALLTNEESKGIRLAFREGKLTLSSRAPEQGESVIELPIEYTDVDLDIGFNPVFLIDALRAAPADTMLFEFKEPNRPGVFRGGESMLYVIMPVNLS